MNQEFKVITIFLLVIFLWHPHELVSQNINEKNRKCLQFVKQWKQATLENLDYQLNLSNNSKDSFARGILVRYRNFINYESEVGGLRKDFADSFYCAKNISPLDCVYLIENYSSGEGFRASLYVFVFGAEQKMYDLQLSNGHWKLKHTEITSIKSFYDKFNLIQSYFCDDYFKEESIVITQIDKGKVTSKGLYFPCSQSFKSIKEIINKSSQPGARL
jgi:hypothetical protein